eukprot:360291-Chlamydomonas_euryale.AAC.5
MPSLWTSLTPCPALVVECADMLVAKAPSIGCSHATACSCCHKPSSFVPPVVMAATCCTLVHAERHEAAGSWRAP